MRHRQLLSLGLSLILLSACAVRKQSCPNCTPETIWRLNTASELQQDEKAYRTLFKDVGDAHRAGTLTDEDVEALNKVGVRLQIALQNANRAFKAYAGSSDQKQQIISLILVAEQILFDLTIQKSKVMVTPR